MAENIDKFPGDEPIFIDANIFLQHAFGTNPGAGAFLLRVESSGLRASTSVLVIEELTFKLMAQSASNEIPRPTVFDLKRILKDAKRREKLLRPVFEYLSYIDALADLGLRIYELSAADAASAREIIRRHGLLPADALHLAVMRRKKIRHLASSDADFAGLEGAEGSQDFVLWRP